MNNKLININLLINNLLSIKESGLSDKINAIQQRLRNSRDNKRLERLKDAESGDVNVIGGVEKTFDVLQDAGITGVQSGVDTVGGGTPGDIALAGLGLPPGTAALIASALNRELDKIKENGKMTPEQEKERLEKHLDKIREKEGNTYYVSYTISKRDPLTKKEEPPELEVWNTPVKALSEADVDNVFKKLMDNYIKNNPGFFGAKYQLQDISDTPIVLPPKTLYRIKVTYQTKDSQEDKTRMLPPVMARSKEDVDKKFDYLWQRFISTSNNPDYYYRSKVSDYEIIKSRVNES